MIIVLTSPSEEAEYERAAAVAGSFGVPPRRSGRAGLVGGVYRCSGRGACNDACAAADGPVRVLVLGALLRAAQRPVEF